MTCLGAAPLRPYRITYSFRFANSITNDLTPDTQNPKALAMLPIRLEMKNFLPYRSPDPVRFEGVHLACLTGVNGAGKSSLLDAITWALWGKARARRDEDLVHLGQQDMYVQLDFEQEGQIYRVIRRRTRRQRGSGTLDLFVQDDDQFNLISEPNMRATQARIDSLLRLDYETFVHSAFLKQGKADAFTTKTPRERKQILSDILGLAQWEVYEAAVKEQLKTIDSELRVFELRLQEIEVDLAQEPALQVALVEAERAEGEARRDLHAAEERLKEYEHAPKEMLATHERLAEVNQRLAGCQSEATDVRKTLDYHQERITEYETTLNTREEIERGHAALHQARATDHALADQLRQLSDFDKQQHELEMMLQSERSDLENECSRYEERIKQLEQKLQRGAETGIEAVQAEVLELQALEQTRETLQAQGGQLGEERAELEATNRALHAEMLSLKDRLTRLQETDEVNCPLCGQPLDAAHLDELVAQLSAEGTQRGDQYRANNQRLKQIADEAKTSRQRLVEIEGHIKRLPALMERLGALQMQVDQAQDAAGQLDSERKGLDDARDLLAREDYGHKTRAKLQKLEERRAAVGYDAESHDAARQQLETYREYERRYYELETAEKELPGVKALYEEGAARLGRLEKSIAEDQQAINTLEARIAELQTQVEEYAARDAEVKTLRASAGNAYQALVSARQELDALEKLRLRKAEMEQRAENKRYEKALYEELGKAFGKNGIPAMMIETAIPELENAANVLLGRMTAGRMALRFTTQREKITGGVAETLDIEIADELGTRGYELYSGGEAFRIDFAIRVALSQLLARRAGARLRTLFIDEGFGTQDADGRDRLVEAITAIQEDFDMILVITHIDDLRDSFPVHVVVDKTAEGSQVVVR